MPSNDSGRLRNAVRGWVGFRLSNWGCEIAYIGDQMLRRANEARPKCPDCEIGPDVGDNCPVCEELYERKKTDEAIYGSGYEHGFEVATNAYRDEGTF